MLRKSKRRIVVDLSDLHSGHKLGLCNPNTILWDEGPRGERAARSPSLGETQKYLWSIYLKHINRVKDIAGRDEVILIHNGDLTHGTRYLEGITSVEIDDQIQTGFYNLIPWFELNVKICRLVLGTGVHTFNGSSEAIIARLLRGKFPKRDIKASSHVLLDIDGITFDVAHHGPFPGSRKWLRGNVVRYYLRDFMEKELDRSVIPANYILRGHYHEYIPPETLRLDRNGDTYESTLVLTPSYCGMTAHGRKASKSVHIQQHGLVVFEIMEGLCRIIPMIEPLDLRTKETL